MSQAPTTAPLRLRLQGLTLTLEQEARAAELLPQLAAKALGVRPQQIIRYSIHKKSLDARKEPQFLYALDLICQPPFSGRVKGRGLQLQPLAEPKAPMAPPPPAGQRLRQPPLIVGAGPAGLFAALALAEAGYRPLLVEQGQPVEQRRRDVERFWQTGELNPASNVQFGEGGAGTFSDGKLTFRGKDPRARRVFEALVEAGAPVSILSWHKPHLGSDVLLALLPRLRARIMAAGGRFLFGTSLTALIQQDGVIEGVILQGVETASLDVETVVVAPGNGARATYELLREAGALVEAKPFAVGLRIEHPQALIDGAQYGAHAGHPLLPTADYQLKYRAADGRSFYSFCMCPGGSIVNAASEPQSVLTNGISLAARASGWANSALVGAVAPGQDFGTEALAGMHWQRELEQAAFRAGGGDYALPACRVEDFLSGGRPQALPQDFCPSSVGSRPAQLRELLPEALAEGLCAALAHWQRQIPGFAAQAVLAGLETRTSAPVRLTRGENRQSLTLAGLYPAGEGAGYAGGIVSSAIDGLLAAEALMEQYLPAATDFSDLAVLNTLAEA